MNWGVYGVVSSGDIRLGVRQGDGVDDQEGR